MTELPPCHTFATEWQDKFHELSAIVNCVTLGEAWRKETPLLSLQHYLPQYVAVNPNLSITLTRAGGRGSRGIEA